MSSNQYTIKVCQDFKLDRDKLVEYLNGEGIGSAVYYPEPLHSMDHFKILGNKKTIFQLLKNKQASSFIANPSQSDKRATGPGNKCV